MKLLHVLCCNMLAIHAANINNIVALRNTESISKNEHNRCSKNEEEMVKRFKNRIPNTFCKFILVCLVVGVFQFFSPWKWLLLLPLVVMLMLFVEAFSLGAFWLLLMLSHSILFRLHLILSLYLLILVYVVDTCVCVCRNE